MEALRMYDTTRLLGETAWLLREDEQIKTFLGYGNAMFAVLADTRMDALEREFYQCLREGQYHDETIIKGYSSRQAYEKEGLPIDYYDTEAEAFLMEDGEAELSFYRAYGISNEVEHVAEDILMSGEVFGS